MKLHSGLSLYFLATMIFFGGLIGVESYIQYDSQSPISPHPHTHPHIQADHPYSDEHWVKVEITVKDNPNPLGENVVEAHFNKIQLPITPPTASGGRGTFYVQVKPGKHKISWTTENMQYAWPKFEKHTEEINIPEKRIWVHISIEGAEIEMD